MTSPITSAAAGTNGTNNSSNNNSTNTSTNGTDDLANEQTFLQLFVSQLQNQDPLNPADGTQFVTQLAQFSQLEQTLNISSDVSAIRQVIAPSTATTSTTPSADTTQNSTSNTQSNNLE
jgi:flagellar basal-body rod modification protein FlgD